MKRDHISVCVCTYKRPAGLKRLLESLQPQETKGLFEFSVIVVDNDRGRSAEQVVAAFRESLTVRYGMEPEANISLARNRTLELAEGQYVAFIDDDEYAEKSWLASLYETKQRFGADGVIGCVEPEFATEPPRWLRQGHFFFKPAPPLPPTGTRLGAGATSNALVSRDAIGKGQLAFDPAFGRSGSEDDKFFNEFLARGFKLVFCAEAVVHETIPIDRQNVAYLWKRHHLQGQNSIRIARLSGKGGWVAMLKSVAATGVYGLMLPVLLVPARPLAIQYWLKVAWHLGFIAGFLHLRVLRDRQQFEAYMQPAKLLHDQEQR